MIVFKHMKEKVYSIHVANMYIGYFKYEEHDDLIVIMKFKINDEYFDDFIERLQKKFKGKVILPYEYSERWFKFETLDEAMMLVKPYMKFVNWKELFEDDKEWLIDHSTFYYSMITKWKSNVFSREDFE